MLIRQKSNLEQFFYSSWKWVVKQQRKLAPSTMHLAQELLRNECTVQWWFKKFCKGDQSLKDECSGWPLEVDSDQLRGSLKLILFQLHEKLLKNSVSALLCFGIWPWQQIGKVKKLSKWVPHELTTNQKFHFKVLSSLILCNNNKPFLNHTVMCEKKWILYDSWWWPAKWLDWEASKHFPKPNLHQKKVVCCRSHPLQHSESQRNHFIWIVCSANRWVASKTATPAAGIAQQKGPNSSA